MRYLLAALIAACSSCNPSLWPKPPAGYYDYQSYKILESSALVSVECVGGAKIGGSAVAVSGRHLLTAKHVVKACEGYFGVEVWKITVAVGTAGAEYEVTVDEVSQDHDVARLVISGIGEPLLTWVVPGPVVKRGQPVCTVAGDVTARLLNMKCGRVSEIDDDLNLITIHVIGGNSGSGLFDSQDRLVGIVIMRSLTNEDWGIAVGHNGFDSLARPPVSPDMN
jgi:trypsin-like peptidase